MAPWKFGTNARVATNFRSSMPDSIVIAENNNATNRLEMALKTLIQRKR